MFNLKARHSDSLISLMTVIVILECYMRLAKEGARGANKFKTVDDGLVLGDKVSYEGNKFLNSESSCEGKAFPLTIFAPSNEAWNIFNLQSLIFLIINLQSRL